MVNKTIRIGRTIISDMYNISRIFSQSVHISFDRIKNMNYNLINAIDCIKNVI
jgi:hypothetical protein